MLLITYAIAIALTVLALLPARLLLPRSLLALQVVSDEAFTCVAWDR